MFHKINILLIEIELPFWLCLALFLVQWIWRCCLGLMMKSRRLFPLRQSRHESCLSTLLDFVLPGDWSWLRMVVDNPCCLPVFIPLTQRYQRHLCTTSLASAFIYTLEECRKYNNETFWDLFQKSFSRELFGQRLILKVWQVIIPFSKSVEQLCRDLYIGILYQHIASQHNHIASHFWELTVLAAVLIQVIKDCCCVLILTSSSRCTAYLIGVSVIFTVSVEIKCDSLFTVEVKQIVFRQPIDCV